MEFSHTTGCGVRILSGLMLSDGRGSGHISLVEELASILVIVFSGMIGCSEGCLGLKFNFALGENWVEFRVSHIVLGTEPGLAKDKASALFLYYLFSPPTH